MSPATRQHNRMVHAGVPTRKRSGDGHRDEHDDAPRLGSKSNYPKRGNWWPVAFEPTDLRRSAHHRRRPRRRHTRRRQRWAAAGLAVVPKVTLVIPATPST
jgi:hypothetical protein